MANFQLPVSAPETTQVDIRSAWLSKINWTQVVAIGCSLLVFATGGKVDIPLEQQLQIVVLIQTAQGLITWIMKTWFTNTVSPASLPSPPSSGG